MRQLCQWCRVKTPIICVIIIALSRSKVLTQPQKPRHHKKLTAAYINYFFEDLNCFNFRSVKLRRSRWSIDQTSSLCHEVVVNSNLVYKYVFGSTYAARVPGILSSVPWCAALLSKVLWMLKKLFISGREAFWTKRKVWPRLYGKSFRCHQQFARQGWFVLFCAVDLLTPWKTRNGLLFWKMEMNLFTKRDGKKTQSSML